MYLKRNAGHSKKVLKIFELTGINTNFAAH